MASPIRDRFYVWIDSSLIGYSTTIVEWIYGWPKISHAHPLQGCCKDVLPSRLDICTIR